jgi:hypothetical protein
MAMTLITTNPDSTDVATVSFTSGIDSTYKLYIFKFYDVNPATDNQEFQFQGSIDGGSNYNVTITSSFFRAHHGEDDSSGLGYTGTMDQAQGTGFQNLVENLGNGADESLAGELYLFNPSNTTYVKHFYSTIQAYEGGDRTYNSYMAGYFNNTNDIDAIRFQMASGNMDGVIKMYGVG